MSKCGRDSSTSRSIRCASRDDLCPKAIGHEGSPGLARLPQHEVERIALASSTSTRAPARRSPNRLPDSFPYSRELATEYMHVAVRSRRTLLPLPINCCVMLMMPGTCVGRARFVIGPQDAQAGRSPRASHRVNRCGERLHGLAVFRGALDDLVVDVGDVAHEGHLVAAGKPGSDVRCRRPLSNARPPAVRCRDT